MNIDNNIYEIKIKRIFTKDEFENEINKMANNNCISHYFIDIMELMLLYDGHGIGGIIYNAFYEFLFKKNNKSIIFILNLLKEIDYDLICEKSSFIRILPITILNLDVDINVLDAAVQCIESWDDIDIINKLKHINFNNYPKIIQSYINEIIENTKEK